MPAQITPRITGIDNTSEQSSVSDRRKLGAGFPPQRLLAPQSSHLQRDLTVSSAKLPLPFYFGRNAKVERYQFFGGNLCATCPVPMVFSARPGDEKPWLRLRLAN